MLAAEQCNVFIKPEFLKGNFTLYGYRQHSYQASWPRLALLLRGNTLWFAKADND